MTANPLKLWWFSEQNELLRFETNLALRWILRPRFLLGLTLLCWLEPYGAIGALPIISLFPRMIFSAWGYFLLPVWFSLAFVLLNPFRCVFLMMGMRLMAQRLRFYFAGNHGMELRLTRLMYRDLWPTILIRPILFGVLLSLLTFSRSLLQLLLLQTMGIDYPGDMKWLAQIAAPNSSGLVITYGPGKMQLIAIVTPFVTLAGNLWLVPGMVCTIALAALPKGAYWKQALAWLGLHAIFFGAATFTYNFVIAGIRPINQENELLHACTTLGVSAITGVILLGISLKILRSRKTEDRIFAKIQSG